MTLAAQIELHRELYRSDLIFNPSQSRPPVAYVYHQGDGLVPDDSPLVINPLKPNQYQIPDSATQSTQVGMPMSGKMLRYLQGPATSETPWAVALKMLRAWCRRNHRYHRAPKHWRGSLCWQLVYMTVVGKPLGDGPATIHEASVILQYDNPEPVLREALQYIEDRMDDFRASAEKRAREDEGQALICVCGHPWSRHDDPATMFRCTACTCRRYNADSGRRAA
jgi:hypothetical protein